MAKVKISVVIPVYNEIRYIQKTLESVIGDADEIILSDNASTDGTSDICQSFANKYPEIKYTRHKENIGSMANYLFCWNQASGKYVRNMGSHDMISIGSNQSMASLLDKHSDVVMVYPKYVISLNQDYSFKSFHSFDEFGNDLLSDSACIRFKSIITNIKKLSIFFGLWRAEILRDVASPRIFQSLSTDHTIIYSTAAKGKMLADEKSIFFRMSPHDNDGSFENQKKRFVNMLLTSASINPDFWQFAIITELYDFILETFSEKPEFCQEMLLVLQQRFFETLLIPRLTLENMPSIIPEKQEFCQNLMNAIKEYIDAKEKQKDAFYDKIQKMNKEVFLFGSGETSRHTVNLFPKIKWKAFIESDYSKVGKSDILPIVFFFDFIRNSKDALVLIASRLYGNEMKQQLLDHNFPEDSIVTCID
ncbi:MAG: glycosyltransferase [Fibromonadaceae bacterium]|jgi:glycosyltransferase involved in cell wall biosynthesis|nr:glycosyltransferase [Fibromonadaceae bacterium]